MNEAIEFFREKIERLNLQIDSDAKNVEELKTLYIQQREALRKQRKRRNQLQSTLEILETEISNEVL